MSDYTDITIHLERAKGQLLRVQEILWKANKFADDIDHIDASNYLDNLDNLIRLIDCQLDKTDHYTDLVEEGIQKSTNPNTVDATKMSYDEYQHWLVMMNID